LTGAQPSASFVAHGVDSGAPRCYAHPDDKLNRCSGVAAIALGAPKLTIRLLGEMSKVALLFVQEEHCEAYKVTAFDPYSSTGDLRLELVPADCHMVRQQVRVVEGQIQPLDVDGGVNYQGQYAIRLISATGFEDAPAETRMRELLRRWAAAENKQLFWEVEDTAVMRDAAAWYFESQGRDTSFKEALDRLNRGLAAARTGNSLPLISCIYETHIVIRTVGQSACGKLAQ
jgi:hypothetical protein